VRPGDKVETVITVAEVVADKKRVVLKTQCRVGATVVIDGEATVLVPSKS
jgi:3-hydroxybutyryl-CoA dehydratase